jgi:hypothetical protein
MAGFTTHVTVSSTLGVAYGLIGHFQYHVAPETAALAGCLCGAAGMLPDLDSDSGRPLRETVGFTASIVPMLMIHRFEEWGMSHDAMALAGIGLYFAVRYGMARMLKRLTVHRGMYHSIPACLIAGLIAFLLCESDTLEIRYFKAGAVMAGFMSHLVLDEIWSIGMKRGWIHVKSSFGTALKLWGESMGPNVFTYSLLAALAYLAVNDPYWMQQRLRKWHNHDRTEQVAGRADESPPR